MSENDNAQAHEMLRSDDANQRREGAALLNRYTMEKYSPLSWGPWTLYEVDDGATHIICAPNETALRDCFGQYSIGADDPESVEVRALRPDEEFILTYPDGLHEADSPHWPQSARVYTTPPHGHVSAKALVSEWTAFLRRIDGQPEYLSCSDA